MDKYVMTALSAEHLRTIQSPVAFRQLPELRTRHICRLPSKCDKRCPCGSCARMHRKLCRRYHTGCSDVRLMCPYQAQDELAMRLAFEVMFGFIRAEHLEEGAWLGRSLRNEGHTKRMRFLYARSLAAPKMAYAWLTKPVLCDLP